MSKNESKKKDKKKLLILVLFLFAIVGIAGYGAYSYFWTDGTITGRSDTVTISSFDPQVSYNGSFIGNGGEITLTCPNTANGTGVIDCSGTIEVYNNGGTDIEVSVSNGTASVDPIYYDSASAVPGDPSFVWDKTVLAPQETAELTISVPVTINSAFASSEAVERDTPYGTDESYSDAIEVKVGFDIIASQVH